MTFDGKSVKRNNNEYLGIENAKLTFKVKRWVNSFVTLNGAKSVKLYVIWGFFSLKFLDLFSISEISTTEISCWEIRQINFWTKIGTTSSRRSEPMCSMHTHWLQKTCYATFSIKCHTMISLLQKVERPLRPIDSKMCNYSNKFCSTVCCRQGNSNVYFYVKIILRNCGEHP